MPVQFLIFFSIALNVVATSAYIADILKGLVRPNKVTFVLWILAPLVTFFAQISQGVGVQSIWTLTLAILPLAVLAASFLNKKAYWKIGKFDIFCGTFSLVGLLLWYLTKIGNMAILFSIIADGLAALPTVIKAYKHPESESALPWLGVTISGFLNLMSIKSWNFQTYGFPLYYTITMFIIFFFTQSRIGKDRQILPKK